MVLSSSGEEALEKHSAQAYDVILLDLLMPGLDGIEVLKGIKKIDPQAVIIIITAYASVESAISAMKMGAYDYIQKPFKHDELLLTIERALEHKSLQNENIRLKDELDRKFGFDNIIGRSQPMQKIFELIKATAPTRSTILIQGESGTGKELVARAIHQNSDRRHFAFIVVNSGSLPPDLLESHLFGHVKGAFTGAVSQKNGACSKRPTGGASSLTRSPRSAWRPRPSCSGSCRTRNSCDSGEPRRIKVDARIIAATNTDLEELIERKAFRQDLFYRLNVIKIELPPLRERKEDIPAAGQALHRRLQPGEREGDRGRERGCHGDPGGLRLAGQRPGARKPDRAGRRPDQVQAHHPRALCLRSCSAAGRSRGRRGPIEARTGPSRSRRSTYQRKVILNALRRAKGVQKKAARSLGLKPTTLNEIIKRLKIDVGQPDLSGLIPSRARNLPGHGPVRVDVDLRRISPGTGNSNSWLFRSTMSFLAPRSPRSLLPCDPEREDESLVELAHADSGERSRPAVLDTVAHPDLGKQMGVEPGPEKIGQVSAGDLFHDAPELARGRGRELRCTRRTL